MVSSDFPEEILIDIFSRLPAKSVGQSRCLSKPWRDILSSRHFIKAHLNRKTHQQNLLLIDKSQSFHSIATIKDGAVSREAELPFGCTEIVGSCDGLVLLVNEEDAKFLVNPVTLEKLIIPNSPLAVKDDGEGSFSMHGFGYDSSIDDYKIVTLSCYDYSDASFEQESSCGKMFVEVYYVKSGVWKRVESESFPCNHAFPEPHPGALLNGAIHWLSRCTQSSYPSVLYAFDLCDEVFIEIPVPDDMEMENCFFYQVLVLGGCLCIIDVRYDCRTNVWIMKEYGLLESWTKLRLDSCGKWGIERPLCFVWDQEMMSVAEGRLLGVYNLKKDGTLRDVIVDGVLAFLEDGVTFVPSLVSPANVDSVSLSDDALVEASAANLALALNNHFLLVQHYRTIVSSDKAELWKRSSELSRDLDKLQAVICRLSRKCGETFLTSEQGKAYVNKMGYKASSKFQVDLYEDVVRGYRCWLRESGQVDEDVITLVEPDVPDSC